MNIHVYNIIYVYIYDIYRYKYIYIFKKKQRRIKNIYNHSKCRNYDSSLNTRDTHAPYRPGVEKIHLLLNSSPSFSLPFSFFLFLFLPSRFHLSCSFSRSIEEFRRIHGLATPVAHPPLINYLRVISELLHALVLSLALTHTLSFFLSLSFSI